MRSTKRDMDLLEKSIDNVTTMATDISEFGKTINILNEILLSLIENNSMEKIEGNAEKTIKSLQNLTKTLEWIVDKNKIERLDEISKTYVRIVKEEFKAVKNEISDLKKEEGDIYIEKITKEIKKIKNEMTGLKKFIQEEEGKSKLEEGKRLGELYYKNEEYEASFEYFNKYILEKIKKEEILEGEDYYNRGKANEALGNIEKAMKDYKKANILFKE